MFYPALRFRWFYLSLLMISLLFSHQSQAALDKSPLYIAFFISLSGEYGNDGQDMLRATQLYLDKVNADGGINGHPIEILKFDSQGQVEEGIKAAKELVKDERVLMVLGHYFSSIAIHLGEVYRSVELPAIISVAASHLILDTYDGFFMINPSTRITTTTLAHSLIDLQHKNQVNLVFDPQDTYSQTLSTSFQENFNALGGHLPNIWELSTKTEDTQVFTQLAQQMKQQLAGDKNMPIFIALFDRDTAQLVISLRRQGVKNPIFAADNINLSFINILKKTPEEQRSPGYFSENIHLIAGLLFDIAGQEAQDFRLTYQKMLGKEPTSSAAFAYDAAKLAVSALRAINAEGQDVKSERKRIKSYLTSLQTPETGINGVTGLTYFSPHRDAVKPPNLAMIKNQHIISDLTQFKTVENPSLLHHLEQELEAKNIIQMNQEYFHKTQVVYTNIELLDITDMKTGKNTAVLEFYLWFRSVDGVDVGDIEFMNAAEPIELGEPIEYQVIDHYHYRLYKVKGLFKLNFLTEYKEDYALDFHAIGVRFQHRQQAYNHLVYVHDSLSSPPVNQSQKEAAEALDTFKQQWRIKKEMVYLDIASKPARGNPLYAEYGKTVDVSRFNQFMLVKQKSLTLRRLMSESMAWIMLFIAIIGFISIHLLRHLRYRSYPLSRGYKMLWLLQIPFLAVFLLAIESVLSTLIIVYKDYSVHDIRMAFDILWWLFPAYFLARSFHHFLWLPIEKRTETPVPPLMRGIVTFIIYMLAIFAVIAFVFNMKITSLLATSGMFAMIIGLAVQMNISNIFSGIAINVDRPFRIGDWVEIGRYPMGKVMDITWRATRIQTIEGNILSIPNAVTADSTVQNYHYPSDVCLASQLIYIDFAYSPQEIKDLIMQAMLSVEGVLSEPAPLVRFTIGEWANEYKALFRLHDYANRGRIMGLVSEAIYARLKEAQISPARPPMMKTQF